MLLRLLSRNFLLHSPEKGPKAALQGSFTNGVTCSAAKVSFISILSRLERRYQWGQYRGTEMGFSNNHTFLFIRKESLCFWMGTDFYRLSFIVMPCNSSIQRLRLHSPQSCCNRIRLVLNYSWKLHTLKVIPHTLTTVSMLHLQRIVFQGSSNVLRLQAGNMLQCLVDGHCSVLHLRHLYFLFAATTSARACLSAKG